MSVARGQGVDYPVIPLPEPIRDLDQTNVAQATGLQVDAAPAIHGNDLSGHIRRIGH